MIIDISSILFARYTTLCKFPRSRKDISANIYPKNFLNVSYIVKIMAELGADLKTVMPQPL